MTTRTVPASTTDRQAPLLAEIRRRAEHYRNSYLLYGAQTPPGVFDHRLVVFQELTSLLKFAEPERFELTETGREAVAS